MDKRTETGVKAVKTGALPNAHGIYECAPDFILEFEDKNNRLIISALETEKGWLSALRYDFGGNYYAAEMGADLTYYRSRLGAIYSRVCEIADDPALKKQKKMMAWLISTAKDAYAPIPETKTPIAKKNTPPLPPELNIVNEPGKIAHVNIRKEGEDQRITAVDVKLSFDYLGEEVFTYFNPSGDKNFFWDERGNSRFTGCAVVLGIDTTIDGCQLAIRDHKFYGNLKKFKFTPRDNLLVALVCTFSFYPGSEHIEFVSALLQESVLISLSTQPQLV